MQSAGAGAGANAAPNAEEDMKVASAVAGKFVKQFYSSLAQQKDVSIFYGLDSTMTVLEDKQLMDASNVVVGVKV